MIGGKRFNATRRATTSSTTRRVAKVKPVQAQDCRPVAAALRHPCQGGRLVEMAVDASAGHGACAQREASVSGAKLIGIDESSVRSSLVRSRS